MLKILRGQDIWLKLNRSSVQIIVLLEIFFKELYIDLIHKKNRRVTLEKS